MAKVQIIFDFPTYIKKTFLGMSPNDNCLWLKHVVYKAEGKVIPVTGREGP
jgi:hypothetical protein